MIPNLEILQVIAIPTLIVIFVLDIKMNTIIIDTLPQDIGKSCTLWKNCVNCLVQVDMTVLHLLLL